MAGTITNAQGFEDADEAAAHRIIVELAERYGAEIQQLGDRAQAKGARDADVERYQAAVYSLTQGLDDDEIAAVWNALSVEARDFGRQQGNEDAGGLSEIAAWALAYEITSEQESTVSAAAHPTAEYRIVVEGADGKRSHQPAALEPGDTGSDEELRESLIALMKQNPTVARASVEQRRDGKWQPRVRVQRTPGGKFIVGAGVEYGQRTASFGPGDRERLRESMRIQTAQVEAKLRAEGARVELQSGQAGVAVFGASSLEVQGAARKIATILSPRGDTAAAAMLIQGEPQEDTSGDEKPAHRWSLLVLWPEPRS